MKRTNNNNVRGKKFVKQQQQKRNNYFTLPTIVNGNPSQSILDQINSVLASTPFNKISVPINIYRKYIEQTDPDNNKVITTGFVKKYDEDTGNMTIIVFSSNNADAIRNMINPAIEIIFSEYPDADHLGTITKLNIVDLEAENEEDKEEESEYSNEESEPDYTDEYNTVPEEY